MFILLTLKILANFTALYGMSVLHAARRKYADFTRSLIKVCKVSQNINQVKTVFSLKKVN